jgi:hypothetical protein
MKLFKVTKSAPSNLKMWRVPVTGLAEIVLPLPLKVTVLVALAPVIGRISTCSV